MAKKIERSPAAVALAKALLEDALDVKISFRDKSVYRSHGKCDTLTNSKTMLFHAF